MQPQKLSTGAILASILLVILIFIALFALGSRTNSTGAAADEATGVMVKVAGLRQGIK